MHSLEQLAASAPKAEEEPQPDQANKAPAPPAAPRATHSPLQLPHQGRHSPLWSRIVRHLLPAKRATAPQTTVPFFPPSRVRCALPNTLKLPTL